MKLIVLVLLIIFILAIGCYCCLKRRKKSMVSHSSLEESCLSSDIGCEEDVMDLSDENRNQCYQQLEEQLIALRCQGWSEQAILKGYLKPIDRSSPSSYVTKRFTQTTIFGTRAFIDLWTASDYALNESVAKWLLTKAMSIVDMPQNLLGTEKEICQLIDKMDSDLEPNDHFWSIFSKTVQTAFPGDRLFSDSSDCLAKKIHQFRYVISAQQAQWIRNHYKQAGWSDAQALAAYISDMDKVNGWLRRLRMPTSHGYHGTYSESSRLHNKIAVTTNTEGRKMIIYPDDCNQVNVKLVMAFHSEFILDESGCFLNAMDPKGTCQNDILNGASFNYADKNNSLHDMLDIKPIKVHDPEFRKHYKKMLGLPYAAPNKLKFKILESPHQKWDNSYYNKNGNYAHNGKSSAQRVKTSMKAFKKMVEDVSDNKSYKAR